MPKGRPAKKLRNAFGDRLFISRTKLGLTQTEIAEKLKIKQSLYQFWERSGKTFTIEQIQNLSEVLKVTPNYLFGKKRERTSSKKKVG